MKVSIPIGVASTLSDLKVWVEEVKPEAIGIPKGHPLTHIRQFNTWEYPDEAWGIFRGIPILYGEQGQLEYKDAPIMDKRINIGYDILNFICDKVGDVPIEHYDNQEELAEGIEDIIIKSETK